jgi:hypothetical protein
MWNCLTSTVCPLRTAGDRIEHLALFVQMKWVSKEQLSCSSVSGARILLARSGDSDEGLMEHDMIKPKS